MEIKRTRILSILVGVFTLASCKIYENKKRDKREEFEMDWQHLQQRQRLYTFRQDTLSRLWYFWTDSAFRFHADSGLFAQSGTVFVQESEGRRSKQLQQRTQKNQQGKQVETRYDKSSNRIIAHTYLWPLIVVLVLFLLWRWNRFRRWV